jgi:hypothetical protein
MLDPKNHGSKKLDLDTCCMKSCEVHTCKHGFEVIPSRRHWNSRKDTVNEAFCCQVVYKDVTQLLKTHEDGDGLVSVKNADGNVYHKKCCCDKTECRLLKTVEASGMFDSLLTNPNGCGALVGSGWNNYKHESRSSKACKITQLEAEELEKTIVALSGAEEV